MSLEANKAIVRRFVEALNKQDLTLLDDLVAPDYVDMQRQGVESAKQTMKLFYTGFPDLHTTIEDIIAEEDKVWVHLTVTGTHTGEYLGFPPTDKKITLKAVDIFRIVDDKMVQGWTVNDFLDFYQQLGVIEYTNKGKNLLAATSISKRETLRTEKRRLTPLEVNKVIIRNLYEADNKKDLAILDEVISPDFVEATLQLRGPEAYKQFETMFFKSFPDWHETIEDIIAEGDKVWVYFKATGTHTGELNILGTTLPPTGKKITITAVQMWRLVDGKVIEKQTVADELEAYEQLGVIEYTEQGRALFPEDV